MRAIGAAKQTKPAPQRSETERPSEREKRPRMTRPLVIRDWLTAGLAAGLVSGVTAAVFGIISAVRAGQPATTLFDFIAGAAGGPVFAGSAAAIPVGIVALFVYTILWAFGYLYGAQKQSQLLTRPILSGVGFGIIVWLFTQAILVGAGKFAGPTIYSFDRDMVGFIIFFGVPLAFTASRLLRSR